MAVSIYDGLKCEWIDKYWIWMTRLVVFLMVLEIFNNESVNSTFKYKLEYKFEYTINLGDSMLES